jgi:hypothetical protein
MMLVSVLTCTIVCGLQPLAKEQKPEHHHARKLHPQKSSHARGARKNTVSDSLRAVIGRFPAHRSFKVVARGPFSLSSVMCPGYYTLVVFSAKWCTNCHVFWASVPNYLEKYPNLVAVEVDCDDLFTSGKQNDKGQFLTKLGFKGALPAAYLISPYGQTWKWSTGYNSLVVMMQSLDERGDLKAVKLAELTVLP